MSRFRLVKIKISPQIPCSEMGLFLVWGIGSPLWHQCLSMEYTDKSSFFTSSGIRFKTAAEKHSSGRIHHWLSVQRMGSVFLGQVKSATRI